MKKENLSKKIKERSQIESFMWAQNILTQKQKYIQNFKFVTLEPNGIFL